MKCKRPRKVNKKDSGRQVLVPCGYCRPCLITKRMQWKHRLLQEEKQSVTAHFLTLTYNAENLPFDNGVPTLVPQHLSNFWKRLRKWEKQSMIYDKLKYYAIGEYGGKFGRPHYHAIVFNVLNPENYEKAWSIYDRKTGQYQPIGNIHMGTVTGESISYCTAYLKKKVQINRTDGSHKEFTRISNGIGIAYSNDTAIRKHHKGNLEASFVYTDSGAKCAMPAYYKNKIFTEEEKDKLEEIARNKPKSKVERIVAKATKGKKLTEKEKKLYNRWYIVAKQDKDPSHNH